MVLKKYHNNSFLKTLSHPYS